jgi:DNA-binding winged helix-turn-helix (wHTH) protein
LERFIRKKLIREKVVEKEVHVADVPIEKAKVYRLPDGTVFDTFAGTLVKGEMKTSLSPQSNILLKLFVRTSNYQVTAEEIDLRLWNGKGSKEQFRTAMSRLRKDLKEVLSPLTVRNEGGIYELKNPHSIEGS